VNKIIEARRKDGGFQKDEMFPNDDEETRWRVQVQSKIRHDAITESVDNVDAQSNIRAEDTDEWSW
jgi:hypothetical protein